MTPAPGPRWRSLIAARDADRLAREAAGVLGVAVPPAAFRAECRRAMRAAEASSGQPLGVTGRGPGWSEDSWWSWLKARAIALGCCAAGARREPPDPVACVLHVGFVGVVETEEHLAMLRRILERVAAGEVARSKIGGTNQVIRPIDRVAARVVPQEPRP